MESGDILDRLIGSISKCSEKPEDFLGIQEQLADTFVNQTKELYDFTRGTLPLDDGALEELITENFDDEQIWQELELQNGPCVDSMLNKVSQLAASKKYHFDIVDDASQKSKSRRKPLVEEPTEVCPFVNFSSLYKSYNY